MGFDPRTTAVIAVDFQNDLITPGGAFRDFYAGPVADRDIIAVTKSLLDTARHTGATVVYTRAAWQRDYRDLTPNTPLLYMIATARAFVDGSPMATIIPELPPEDGDLIVTHQRISAFTGTTLDAQLRARAITTLLFTGVATNTSVESTARAAIDLGYRTLLIEDACAAATTEAHHATTASMVFLGGITTSTDAIHALKDGAAEVTL